MFFSGKKWHEFYFDLLDWIFWTEFTELSLGLHSAYQLTEAGVKNVVVLESADRIGGRINSIPMNGKWIEFGAQWIHGQGKNPLWKFIVEKQVLFPSTIYF
jgi:monoamine oxidase